MDWLQWALLAVFFAIVAVGLAVRHLTNVVSELLKRLIVRLEMVVAPGEKGESQEERKKRWRLAVRMTGRDTCPDCGGFVKPTPWQVGRECRCYVMTREESTL